MKLVNIYNSRRQIYLFCRDDKGNLIIDKKDDFFPYFYELNPDGKFKNIKGEPVKKIFVSEPSDVPKARSNNSYEADILFVKRYMIDRVKKLDKCPIKYALVDIEVLADELPNTQEAIYPISCISVYNSFTKEIKTWYLGDYGIGNENKMLRDFINYMQEEKFDLWLSWNVKFDYNYLFNRIEPMKFDFNRKSFPELISPINKLRYGDGEVFYPAGISIVDYLLWDKKVTLNRRKSYALDNVSQEELKDTPNEKIEFGKLNPKIKEKNIRDIGRMAKLEEKLKYIEYFDEIRRLTKIEWEDMIWNSRIIDMLLLQEAKERKITLPMKPAEERGTLTEKEEYAGAYRDVFKTGRISPVGVYDIGSAYPSMIINFCLDPANIAPNSSKNCFIRELLKIEDTYFKQNSDALLPTVVKKMMTIKNNIKSELSKCPLNSGQHKKIKVKYDAIKSVVNSAYGVFGLRFFRLFKKEVASATTFLVRDLLHYVQDKLEKQGHEIIYIDTDSIMINNNSEDISNTLNEYVKQWAKEKYNKDNTDIEFEYKGYFDPIILLRKCRYKGWLVTNKGIEVKTKGIEARRKDSTTYMKKFQIELLDKIKNKEPKKSIFDWIKAQILYITNESLKDVAFPCKLSRKPKEYKNLPIFVRALNNIPNFKKKVGNNFYYIFVKPQEELNIKTNIVVEDYLKDPDDPESMMRYEETLDKNLSRIEGIEYIRNKLQKPKLETSRIKVLHQKEKPKDVMAFDEDNNEHIKRDMVDWDMVIKRNIIMKLDTIFEAMGWDVKEIGYQPTPKLPKIKAEPAQIEPKGIELIERPQELEKAPKNIKIGTNEIKLFEMFGGYGGASFALKKANIPFECVGYSEIKPHAIEIYDLNHPNAKNYGDCTKIIPQNLPNFDLLTGGFPCQDVSMGVSLNTIKSGQGYLSKGRTLLFNDILRIAQVKQPKYMLLENVKSLTYKNHEKMFNYILTSLDLIGYKVHWKVLSSLDYNTPQRRERVYFACFRRDIYEGFSFPPKEIYTNDWRNYIDDPKNFKKVNKTPSRDTMRKKCKNITNSLYSYTITLKQDRYPNAGIIDFEDYYRFLTPREQFRLQGFFNDEIKLIDLPNSKLEDLAGDGWDINLVSKIFKEMFKK